MPSALATRSLGRSAICSHVQQRIVHVGRMVAASIDADVRERGRRGRRSRRHHRRAQGSHGRRARSRSTEPNGGQRILRGTCRRPKLPSDARSAIAFGTRRRGHAGDELPARGTAANQRRARCGGAQRYAAGSSGLSRLARSGSRIGCERIDGRRISWLRRRPREREGRELFERAGCRAGRGGRRGSEPGRNGIGCLKTPGSAGVRLMPVNVPFPYSPRSLRDGDVSARRMWSWLSVRRPCTQWFH